MITSKTRQILIPVFTVATIIVNFLAGYLPINGMNTAEISDSVPTFFTPAGYVFSIWGLIYLGLLAFSYYQAQPEAKDAKWLDDIAPAYILGSIANMVWIFLWHYLQFGWTILFMLIILGSLVYIYHKLKIGYYQVSAKTYWLVHFPFSVYLGWISVATVANMAVFLTSINWDGFGIRDTTWTMTMLLIATILGVVSLLWRKDYAYASVIVWALIGIYIARGMTNSEVGPVALVLAVILPVIAIANFLKPKVHILQSSE